MSALDGLLQREAAVLVLELTRITGVIIAAPLPWSTMPVRLRAALVVLVGLAIHQPARFHADAASDPLLLAIALISELLVGAALGFIVRLAVAVAEIASDAVTPMMGFGAAQMFDPQAQTTHSALTTLVRNLVLLLFVLAGVHRIVLAGLVSSFSVLPPGSLVALDGAAPDLLELTGGSLESGIRIALPVMACLFMTQIALAFTSRAAPAMQIFSVGFAVTLAVGTLVLVLVLPDWAYELLREAGQIGPRIERLLLDLAPPPSR